jgi:hypothetical protein
MLERGVSARLFELFLMIGIFGIPFISVEKQNL